MGGTVFISPLPVPMLVAVLPVPVVRLALSLVTPAVV